jgi:hypothetical protein
MPSPQRTWAGGLWWGLLALWMVLLLAGIGFVALTAAFPGQTCYRDGASSQGALSWSALPPGYVCTWTKERGGLDAKQGPGSLPSIYLATMAGAGLALVRWRPARSERLRASVFEAETDRG